MSGGGGACNMSLALSSPDKEFHIVLYSYSAYCIRLQEIMICKTVPEFKLRMDPVVCVADSNILFISEAVSCI